MQEVRTSEDLAAGSDTAFVNIFQPAYVCVLVRTLRGSSLVVCYDSCSETVYLLVKGEKKRKIAIFMAKRLFSQSALPVFLLLLFCFLL